MRTLPEYAGEHRTGTVSRYWDRVDFSIRLLLCYWLTALNTTITGSLAGGYFHINFEKWLIARIVVITQDEH